MAEPLKNLINAEMASAAALHLRRAWSGFDSAHFLRLALHDLEHLELKARADQSCDAFEATLPVDFDAAAVVIESSLAPIADIGSAALPIGRDGVAGWIVWPLAEFVARRVIDSPKRALVALHALTQRLTAEWAIRPFIERHPQLCFATLREWTSDPSPHVRRLVSEGSRPRLPWGRKLKTLIADPSPTLPLLRALQDDPNDYVRRSVANHLNDIAKDHPQLVALWIEEHLAGASAQRRALLRHASRTLIKQAHPGVLKAWGIGRRFEGEVRFGIRPKRVQLGASVQLDLKLRSTSNRAQRLAVDYAVHHVKANGSTSPKVFKGWLIELAGKTERELTRQHAIRPITTRRYHAGRHLVELLINGKVAGAAAFTLAA